MNLWNVKDEVKDLQLPSVNTYRATNDNIDLKNLQYLMVDDDSDVEIVDYVNDLNKNKRGMSVSSRGFYNIVGEVIDVDDSMLEENKPSPVKFNESIGIEDSTNKKKDDNKNTLKGNKQIDIKKILSYDADEDSKVIDITNNIDKAEEDLGEVIYIEDSISIIEENENCDSSGNVSDGSIEIVDISKRNVNKKSYKIGKNYSAKKMRGSEEELYLMSNIKNIEKKFNDSIIENINGTLNKKLKKLDMSIQQSIKGDENTIEVLNVTRKKRKHFKKKKRKMVNYIGKVDTNNSIKKSKQKIEHAKNKRKRCDFVSENVWSKKIKLEPPNMNRHGHNQHSSKNVLMKKKKKQQKKNHQ